MYKLSKLILVQFKKSFISMTNILYLDIKEPISKKEKKPVITLSHKIKQALSISGVANSHNTGFNLAFKEGIGTTAFLADTSVS